MTDVTAESTANNPFSSPSPLAFEAPAFDLIREEHYLPAFTSGMEQHLREVQKISDSEDAPTFASVHVRAIEPSQ